MMYLIIIIPFIVILICTFTDNHSNVNNKVTNYFDDDCGSSQYIEYMDQFTSEQHQSEMDREVKEIWGDITYANLSD